jgi:hypothetical protein
MEAIIAKSARELNCICRSFPYSYLNQVGLCTHNGIEEVNRLHRIMIQDLIRRRKFDAYDAWVTFYFCELSNEVWVYVHKSKRSCDTWNKKQHLIGFEWKYDRSGAKYIDMIERGKAHYIFTI